MISLKAAMANWLQLVGNEPDPFPSAIFLDSKI
jgi:hypothetical protein